MAKTMADPRAKPVTSTSGATSTLGANSVAIPIALPAAVPACGGRNHYFGKGNARPYSARLRSGRDGSGRSRTASLADIRGDWRRPDTLRHDFRGINPADAQILLIEGSDRILSTFPPHLSEAAERALI